ncbi:MAG: adenylate/guanylate cyclase domain-containing protein, partial [Alphaproteobacteria bacterium]|nr:adenylate/guanylate cyclase domain-containing protein [Alphaproteobacteria bacterium]
MRLRDALVVAAVVAVANGLTALPAFRWVDGLSTDLTFWLRHQAFGARHAPDTSPTVVVAIDEETYRQPPFRDRPQAMWTPEIARVLQAVIEGGARVVGFDLIFPTSVERHVPGFEREFLLALRDGARAGKVVLGKVQHQAKPISPFPAQRFAVGHERNIRSVNVIEDEDGIIRRVPLWFRTVDRTRGERREPSMAVEIAARALGVEPVIEADGTVRLGDRRLAAPEDKGVIVNFDGGNAIPTYSLVDLFQCADADYFRRHFAGKAVMIGVVLDVEDRKLSSKRLITAPETRDLPPRCTVPVDHAMYVDRVRDTIPGVTLLGAAVNDIVRGETARAPERAATVAIGVALAGAAGIAVLVLSPVVGWLAYLAGIAVWIGAVTLAFRTGLLLPLLAPIVAAGLAVAILYAWRFAVADRDKRFLRRAFSLYLPEPEVERLASSGTIPALGGEERELTILFTDIEGFTAISETHTPETLVAGLNAYLSALGTIVEAHGGIVDKYMGDGLIAVFGAPIADPDHARHAVEAACAIASSADLGTALAPGLRTGIGVNSGEAVVGNVGSARRLNYTVMGDAVNLASRLEGANKAYGTTVLVSERTRLLCGAAIGFREIDTTRVVGRAAPVVLHSPADPNAPIAAYADALKAYRAGAFDRAAAGFAALASADRPARAMAA